MKTIGIIMLLMVTGSQITFAQYMASKGKIKTISFSISPVASLRSDGLPLNYSNASIQFGKLLFKGVCYSVGYAYHQNNGLLKTTQRENKWNVPTFEKGHSAFATLEVRKMLFSTGGSAKTSLRCFYKNLGLSLSPEYQYLFPIKGMKNISNGEFALRTGLYYHQGSTKLQHRINYMFSIYYKKAMTPLVMLETPIGNKSYFYDEAGIKLTLLLKKLYRFDNYDRK
jgi:hypothetical protein